MPEQYRVDLAYRLAGPLGRSADTQSKTWYFDLAVVHWDEFADRQQRMANLVTVRPAGAFRRVPGSTPFVSGPLRDEDLPSRA